MSVWEYDVWTQNEQALTFFAYFFVVSKSDHVKLVYLKPLQVKFVRQLFQIQNKAPVDKVRQCWPRIVLLYYVCFSLV